MHVITAGLYWKLMDTSTVNSHYCLEMVVNYPHIFFMLNDNKDILFYSILFCSALQPYFVCLFSGCFLQPRNVPSHLDLSFSCWPLPPLLTLTRAEVRAAAWECSRSLEDTGMDMRHALGAHAALSLCRCPQGCWPMNGTASYPQALPVLPL